MLSVGIHGHSSLTAKVLHHIVSLNSRIGNGNNADDQYITTFTVVYEAPTT